MKKKTCTTCNTVKSLDQFAVQSSRKDGRKTQCKACCKKRDDNRKAANKVAKAFQRAEENKNEALQELKVRKVRRSKKQKQRKRRSR